jgi:uncharacterized protein
MNLVIAFVTGLTAGGLGCLALQGGLLTACIAQQIGSPQVSAIQGATAIAPRLSYRIAIPIGLFLLAKLIAYTILGFLLGAFGSALQLTPISRVVLMLAIGVFMLGNGLRMLNVHPVFRYFVIEPPSSVTRFILRLSENGVSMLTPVFLGSMTVLLPCGIAQSFMAAAMGSGDPLHGAAILFAFTLGTSPLFFSIAYFATKLGATTEKYFTRIVAVVMLLFGLLSFVYGLNLAGAPVELPQSVTRYLFANESSDTARESGAAVLQDEYTITVKNEGYSPKVLHLPAEKPVVVTWVTNEVTGCSLSVVIPGLDHQMLLPSTGRTQLTIPAREKGSVLNYSCSMGRKLGRFIFY